MNRIIIGNRIRDKREEKSLTQEKLAELVNMSVVSISNLETGNTNPNFKTIVDVTEVLEMSIDLLVSKEPQVENIIKIQEINKLLLDLDNWELDHIADYIKLFVKSLKNRVIR